MPKLKWTTHADLAIERRPCVSRQEYLDYMTFAANERPLFTEPFGPIIGLKEEWEEQGASAAELDFSAFRYRCAQTGGVPVNTGLLGGFPEVVLEETDDYRLTRDRLGRTMKLHKAVATLALPLDYPVRTMDDWLKFKPWYQFSEARFADNWAEVARAHLAAGRVVTVGIPGGFDQPRQLLGEEGLCMACYDDPELVHDILATIGATAEKVLDRVSATVTVDQLSVHEDMAGKSGPLLGERQIREFVLPYYRRIWDMLADRGARLFDQDSDGNMNPVIDVFLDAGVNCMHPIEPAAGMDPVALRRRYGTRLAMVGGIDKHTIRRSLAAIDAELERKLPPLIATGGCVIGLDHRIPNGTPLANYRHYVAKVWEIIERQTA